MKVLVGADPELFLIDKETEKVISAIDLIPGEKGRPYRDKSWPAGYGMEIDNILAEYNIPPVNNDDDFVKVNLFMQNKIREFIKEKKESYDIKASSSEWVDKEILNHPIAKLFGCSVDFNVYTESANPKPKGETTNLRSAGFHIHIGYKKPKVSISTSLVKYLDMYLGIPSVLIDKDKDRRSLYGKAGCFRLTPYGVEYRTLSGYFGSNIEYLRFLYDGTMNALRAYDEGIDFLPSELVQECINTGNIDMANTLIKEIKF